MTFDLTNKIATLSNKEMGTILKIIVSTNPHCQNCAVRLGDDTCHLSVYCILHDFESYTDISNLLNT